jgi:CubicO group peptidase (beta-lactamase class C family)
MKPEISIMRNSKARGERVRASLSPDGPERIQTVEEGLAPAYILKGVNDRQPRSGIRERMRHWHVPGVSVAVINDGVIEWAKGYGEVEAGGSTVDAETIFQTGSIGKTLTAVTVLALVDRGVLDLDRDVNEYLVSWRLPETELAEGESVTLERILNHSAGLTVHGFPGYAPGEPLPTLKQMLDGESPCNSGAVSIGWKPGTEWRYSNGGYLVAQQVIEDATGRLFSDVVEELVLERLGMTRSFYRSQLGEALLGNAAMGHQADGSIMSGRYRSMPEYGAGAGLWSTPSDLAKLASSIMRAWAGGDGESITTEATRNMLTARLGGYGLGICVRGEDKEFAFSHGGDITGFHSYLIVFPELGQGAAIMTNGAQGTLLYGEILHAIADAYEWPDLRPINSTVVDVDPARLDNLAGSYDLAGFDRIPLTVMDGALHVPDISGGGDPIRLYPVGLHTFVDPVYGWAFFFEQDASSGVWRAEVTFGVYHLSAVKD